MKAFITGSCLILLFGCSNAVAQERGQAPQNGAAPAKIGVTSKRCDRSKFKPVHRLRGVWLDEFEGSRFFPGAKKAVGRDAPGDRIWLEIKRTKVRERVGIAVSRAWLVEVTGQQSACAGRFGHFGQSNYELVADEIRVIRELKAVAR